MARAGPTGGESARPPAVGERFNQKQTKNTITPFFPPTLPPTPFSRATTKCVIDTIFPRKGPPRLPKEGEYKETAKRATFLHASNGLEWTDTPRNQRTKTRKKRAQRRKQKRGKIKKGMPPICLNYATKPLSLPHNTLSLSLCPSLCVSGTQEGAKHKRLLLLN